MSKINLPELPPPLKEIAWLGGRPQDVYGRDEMRSYAEQAVREALAAQVAEINKAVASMGMYEVSASAIRKEYFKAGARRVIQAVNSAITPENDHGQMARR